MVMLLIPYFPNSNPDSTMILSLTSTSYRIFGKYMKTFLVFIVFGGNFSRKSASGDFGSVNVAWEQHNTIFLLLLRA
jgi:hypothetical protein